MSQSSSSQSSSSSSSSYTDENPISIKVTTLNLCHDSFAEEAIETSWDARVHRLELLIQKINADVLCLQEVRDIGNKYTVNQFLAKVCELCGYQYTLQYRDARLDAFGQAILWKRELLYNVKTFNYWLSDQIHNPPDHGPIGKHSGGGNECLIVGAVLRSRNYNHHCISVGNHVITVLNVRFPMNEERKTYCIERINRLLREEKIPMERGNLLMCGDLNIFEDEQGLFHRQLMGEQFYDVGLGAVSSRTGRCPRGTFVGYEHDKFKATLPDLTRPNDKHPDDQSMAFPSRLDHILMYKGAMDLQCTMPEINTETMMEEEPEELTVRNAMVSDHLPLSVTVKCKPIVM